MTWLFAIIALLCEIIGTVGGFGSSVFFVPLAGFFFNLKIVLGLTAVLHVFSNLAKIILFRKHIDYKLMWLFGIPSTFAVMLGAWIVTVTDIRYGELILSIFLLSFSAFFYFKPNFILPPNKANAITGGSIAGFLAGLIGTGGAVRGASMTAFNLEKSVFVGTSAAIDMGVDFSRSIIYLENGFIGKEHLPLIPILLFVSFVGSYIGKRIFAYVSQVNFKKIVLGLIFIIGIITFVKSIQ
ncbi:MAG TPA: sulfite exporter TauE/SafE family protein [Bacteroidia bacterium]|nr:sulfite exporter TauE/SafE family protein [Bacteroidia bacterium]